MQALVRPLSLVEECATLRSGSLRLTTPFLYPNGEKIELFLEKGAGLFPSLYLSDYGHTVHLLEDTQIRPDSTYRKKQVLSDILKQLNIELLDGALRVLIDSEKSASMTDSLFRLAQACMRVSDFATHQRLRSVNAFRDDIEDFFDAQSLQYVPDVRVQGPYEREVRVDFQVKGKEKPSFVQVLAAMNEASAHTSTNEILRKWSDLQKTGHFEEFQFVTVFNSTSKAVRNDDIMALRDASNVASYPDEADWLRSLLESSNL